PHSFRIAASSRSPRSSVIDDVPTFTTASMRRSHSFFIRELERTDAHEITIVHTRPRQRALDAHAAQSLLYVRHRLVVREVGERARALGRPAGDAPRPLAFAHDVEALLLRAQHDV